MPRKKNSGLGRGLDAIFFDNTISEDTTAKENKITVIILLDMDNFWCNGALRCLLPVPVGQ